MQLGMVRRVPQVKRAGDEANTSPTRSCPHRVCPPLYLQNKTQPASESFAYQLSPSSPSPSHNTRDSNHLVARVAPLCETNTRFFRWRLLASQLIRAHPDPSGQQHKAARRPITPQKPWKISQAGCAPQATQTVSLTSVELRDNSFPDWASCLEERELRRLGVGRFAVIVMILVLSAS